MATCKGCESSMVWAVHESNGRGVPLDPEPVDDGNLVATGETQGDQIVVRYVRKGEDTGVMPRYVTHFSSCTSPDEFRSKRATR